MNKCGPLALAVLGLLAEQPRHPYDIAFTMQMRHMDEHIKLSLGTLYHVVEQLHRLDWIQPTETAREGRRPERTIYSVTPTGRRHLQQRVRELIAEPSPEYSKFEAGLTFVHQLPRHEAVALLRRRAAALQEQIDLWDRKLEHLREKGVPRYGLLEVEMVQGERRFQVGWAQRIAEEIESEAIDWAPCDGQGATPNHSRPDAEAPTPVTPEVPQ